MKALILVLLPFAMTAFGAEPVSLHDLPKSDSLRVAYESQGCFHLDSYKFVFRRADAMTVEITKIESRWDPTQKRRVETGRELLGTTELTDKEVAGLDRLISFYRSGQRSGFCTTIDNLTITQVRNGSELTKESIVDNSCESREVKDLVLLPDLVEKLEAENAKSRP